MSYPSEQSIIDGQEAIIGQLVVPTGTNLSAGPGSLDPVLGCLAQDPNLPGDLFIGNGVGFTNISGNVSTLIVPTVVDNVVVYGNTTGTEIDDSGVSINDVVKNTGGAVISTNLASFSDVTGRVIGDSGYGIAPTSQGFSLVSLVANPNIDVSFYANLVQKSGDFDIVNFTINMINNIVSTTPDTWTSSLPISVAPFWPITDCYFPIYVSNSTAGTFISNDSVLIITSTGNIVIRVNSALAGQMLEFKTASGSYLTA